jgi:protein-tyrosine-phosphatase
VLILKVLFVCTGNTCRSAMCEGIFSHLVENKSIEVFSAGISADEGANASENAVEALNQIGIDISNHKSKLLTKDDILNADLVLCMTDVHKMLIQNACPNEKHKIHTLCEYAKGTNEKISDPYGMDINTYISCAKNLKELIEIVLKKVTNND